MAYINVTSTTSNSISVNLSGLDTSFNGTDRICHWHLNGVYKGQAGIDAYVSSGGDYTFTGLSASTTYTISVTVKSERFDDVTFSTTETTSAAAVVPSIASFTASQISGTLNALCQWSINNASSTVTYEIRASTTYPSNFLTGGYQKGSYSYEENSGVITFDKAVTAYVWLNLFQSSTYITSSIITVTISIVKPNAWSWYASNGSATATQTTAAYNAVTNKGNTSSFSYLVWNDMVAKVNEVLTAISGTWNSAYATYYDTLMSSSDKQLTAVRFNSLKYNIDLHYSTGISAVSSGNTVYGWYFTTLAYCINQWINSL